MIAVQELMNCIYCNLDQNQTDIQIIKDSETDIEKVINGMVKPLPLGFHSASIDLKQVNSKG
ncbi:6567_t:CDS:2 [Racocetra fulgida]|uniref:6567_t:CDS:1 n=1 Tax=Racocetra fulgida TaxID=60492 RepID=A0A9N9C8D2_9GLOM|nr:6567_t:CDS:2 [Racocetra fulgida]